MLRPARKLSLLMLLPLTAVLTTSFGAPEPEADLEAIVSLYRQEGPEKALPEFELLAETFGETGLRRKQAIARGFVGECHWRMGNFELARTHLNHALSLKRALQDHEEEAKTLNVLGLLEWDLGNYDQAIANFSLARAAGRDLGNKKLEGAALNNLSLVYDELGDYTTSLTQYEEVLTLYADANFQRGEGDTLGNIGGVYLLLGRYRDALNYYERALTISEQLESKPSMSQDHGNIAMCQLGLGDIDMALIHFEQAIALARLAGMRQDEAYWMRGAANALVEYGRYDQALERFRTALATYIEIGAPAEHLETLHDIGQLHLTLGDAASAEAKFKRAIAVARKIGLARGVTLNLIALGDLNIRRNNLKEAISLYSEAQRRAEKAGEQAYLAESLLRLSLAHREGAKFEEAFAYARDALVIARNIGARPLEAEARYALAELERRSGQPKRALTGFTDAAAVLQTTGDPDLGWQILFGRAQTLETLGHKEVAIQSLTAAVRLIEDVLNRLKEERFRTGYVQNKYQVYVELVRLQLEMGRIGDAFSTAERLRARSYAALIRHGGSPQLSDESRRREHELRERVRQLRRALDEEQRREEPQRRQLALENFSAELLAAERDYQGFLDDHAHSTPAPATERSIPSSADVQQRLAPGEALIEYIVGREGISAFVITPSDLFAKTIPVRRVDIIARVELLRDLIKKPSQRWRKPAASLSAVLIESLETTGWLDDTRHLYLVPHGVLNYVPFAALPGGDGKDLLLDRYALAYLPTAAALLIERPAVKGENSLLVMAPARGGLRYAPDEARSLDSLFKPNSHLLIGKSATETRFKALAGDYRTLHMATHGYFNKLNPLFSGLELEPDEHNDGLLEVHEILQLKLNAELVTLSACETALGSGYFADVPAGDEFVGLTRAFLSAGSRSVMATLWEVDDRSSVHLMKKFYERLNETGASKALALAAAQRELRSMSGFEHPYHWAPFIFVGKPGSPASTRVSEVTL